MRPRWPTVQEWRALLRPNVTYLLVGAYVLASFIDPGATEHLREFALVTLTFWFAERAITKRDDEG